MLAPGEFLLNLFPVKINTKVRRAYFYNPGADPEIFAKNLTRVNHIRFQPSKDLVWLETPDISIQLLPFEVYKYKLDKEEVIDGDERLFAKTLYAYIGKLFVENGYSRLHGKNEYIRLNPLFQLSSNQHISCHLSYTVKLYKLNDQHYICLKPKFSFLSSQPALKSQVKGAYVLNLTSGKKFPYLGAHEESITIQANGNEVSVKYPDSYFFNFSTVEAEKLGFLKEVHKIYKDKLKERYNHINSDLSFLKTVVDFGKPYKTQSTQIINSLNEFQFRDGVASKASEIFKLGPIKNENRELKLAVFFSSKDQLKELAPTLKLIFSKDKLLMKALKQLNYTKVSFVPNPVTKKPYFLYDPERLEPLNRAELEKLGEKIYALVILDKYYGNLVPLIANFPSNFILMPILKENILQKQVYVLNSFAYKMLNFTEEAMPYYVKLPPHTLFIGIDLTHDIVSRKSALIISAVDYIGKPIYVGAKRNLELSEKFDVSSITEHLQRIVHKYEKKFGKPPARVIILRDGTWQEDIKDIASGVRTFIPKLALVEILKNSAINTPLNLQEFVIKLTPDSCVYFPKTYHNQNGVEIRIRLNETDLDNEKLMLTTYKTTVLYHPTPYTTLKLPYPLYITDKVGLVGGEWKLYIPYFV